MSLMSLDDIERRIPVLDRKSAKDFPEERIEREWLVLTETVRQAILQNPEARKKAAAFTASPVCEELPHAFFTELASQEGIVACCERYREKIVRYLALEAVPNEHIQPDLRNAARLHNVKETFESLEQTYGKRNPECRRAMKDYVRAGYFTYGISKEEKELVIQRYRFARDIKLLALEAELLDQKDQIQVENGSITLPSGTNIHIETDDESLREMLTSPQTWKGRRQIKDRVHEVQIGDRKLILKERKTARHLHTQKRCHKPGLTAQAEFEVARHFQEYGNIETEDFKVSWENPLAWVSFPDGFQFTVFEHEEKMIDADSILEKLAERIRQNQKAYQKELRLIRMLATRYYDHDRVLTQKKGRKRFLPFAVFSSFAAKIELPTLEEFSRVKALRMQRIVTSMMQEAVIRNSFENGDTEDYAFRIHEMDDGRLKLEIVGFDFEYFSKRKMDDVEMKLKSHQDFERAYYVEQGINICAWNKGNIITKSEEACYLALLEFEEISV